MTLSELLKQVYRDEGSFFRTAGIVEKRFTDPEAKSDPIYIKILVAVAAWFSAGFIILSLEIAKLLKDGGSAAIIGLIFIVAAIAVSLKEKRKKNIFINQLCLALAAAGNGLILIGIATDIAGNNNELPALFITQVFICCIVYPAYGNSIYRFLAPIAAAVFAVAWIVDARMPWMLSVIIAVEMILFGILVLKRTIPVFLEPLMYSAAAMLPATILFMNIINTGLPHFQFYVSEWPSSIIVSAGIIYLVIEMAGGMKSVKEPWLILAIISAAVLGAVTTPGIPVAIGLMIAGYAFGNRFLLGLSFVFLPCFLFFYYYSLNIDLAYKSYILAGSGMLLLAVREAVKLVLPSGVKS
jgi:hypothetical protein